MEKLFYTIGETAELIGESVSLVRFWTNTFEKFLKPRRNAKGNRIYTSAEIDTLRQIHHLVKDRGLSLEGAAKNLELNRSGIDRNVKIIDSLKAIREQLVEIKKSSYLCSSQTNDE